MIYFERYLKIKNYQFETGTVCTYLLWLDQEKENKLSPIALAKSAINQLSLTFSHQLNLFQILLQLD